MVGLRTIVAGAVLAAAGVRAGGEDSIARELRDEKTLSKQDEAEHLEHYHEAAMIRREDSERREALDKKFLTPEQYKEHREHYEHDIAYLKAHDPAKFGFLRPNDGTAISFWIISIAMVATTVFLLWEAQSITYAWKTSIHIGSLVTLIAGVHYFYMREYWITLHNSPIVYRYIDWSLTVPLQMVEFYFILTAAKPDLGAGMFFRLLFGTVVMLAFGFAGEELWIHPTLGFIFGMCGWGFILAEIFFGEASQVANLKEMGSNVKSAYQTCRFIVTVGWSIYPLGYFFGYMEGAVAEAPLNLFYNLADFVNKIAFCLAIWHCAKKETLARQTSGMGQALI